MIQPNKKQSAAIDNRIIKAVAALGPTAKTEALFQFLHEKRHAPYLAKTVLQCRLGRLRRTGRVIYQTGHRNPDEMGEWRSAIANIVRGQSRQLGVRGVFYLAVAAGLCEKNELAYHRVQVALVNLRMSGEVEFSSIIDTGRTIHPYGLDERSPCSRSSHVKSGLRRDSNLHRIDRRKEAASRNRASFLPDATNVLPGARAVRPHHGARWQLR